MTAAAAPRLYFDVGSPYAYLAAERVERVLGTAVEFEPVLAGAIFNARGRGSWGHTGERAGNVAEVERRAAEYGLPPLRWPPGWPNDTLAAMRVATWAKRRGGAREVALALFRGAFAAGADVSDPTALQALVAPVLPGAQVEQIVADPAIKAELRTATDRAYAAGVVGVPCLELGGRIHYGDDRLEAAASQAAS